MKETRQLAYLLVTVGLLACPWAGSAVDDLDAIDRLSHRIQQNPNDEEALNGLIEVAQSEGEDTVLRTNALTQLGVCGEAHPTQLAPRVVPILEGLVRSPDLYVRRNAARAIGSFGENASGAVDGLLWVLEDPRDVDAKYFAARSLGQIRVAPEKVVPALLDLASEASRNSIAGVEAIAEFGSSGKKVIMGALRGHDEARRAASAWALAWMGEFSDDVQMAAIESLMDSNPELRWVGVRTAKELLLRGRASEGIKKQLLIAADDPDRRVRNEVEEVLRSVRGQSFAH